MYVIFDDGDKFVTFVDVLNECVDVYRKYFGVLEIQ